MKESDEKHYQNLIKVLKETYLYKNNRIKIEFHKQGLNEFHGITIMQTGGSECFPYLNLLDIVPQKLNKWDSIIFHCSMHYHKWNKQIVLWITLKK